MQGVSCADGGAQVVAHMGGRPRLTLGGGRVKGEASLARATEPNMPSFACRSGSGGALGAAHSAGWLVTLLAPLLAIGAAPASAAAPDHPLAPHRAVYDLSLSRVEASVSILSITGTLVYEIEGSWCDGYTVTTTFQIVTVDREGQSTRTGLRASTFETLSPPEFSFLNQTVTDTSDELLVQGQATGTPAGTVVELEKPVGAHLELPRAVFPSQHAHLLLDAGVEGERVLEAPMFDGGGAADEVFDTTTVIGPGTTGLPGATDRETRAFGSLPGAADMPSYAVSISYFSQDAQAGEPLPEQVIGFRLLGNGVVYAASFDYGQYALGGRLTELRVDPVPECPAE